MHHSAVRARILKAATRSFSEKGYHRTDMDDVARAAHCSESALAHLFPSKADLFTVALIASSATRAARKSIVHDVRTGHDFEVYMREMMSFLYSILDNEYARMRMFGYLERPDLMRKFLEEKALPYHTSVSERMRVERSKGVVRRDVDIESAVAAMLFLCEFRRVFESTGFNMPGMNLTRRDNMRHFADIWLHGVMEKSEISTVLHE